MSVMSNDASDLNVTLNQLTITGGNTVNAGGGIRMVNGYSGPYEYNDLSVALTNSTVSEIRLIVAAGFQFLLILLSMPS